MNIKETTSHIAEILHQVSGLPDFEERVCAYYCLSSWFVNQINPFPILNLTGPNATGKSSSLAVFRRLAFQPYGFTATDMSGPVIRDELGKAHNATAVIEEADNAKGDIESFLGLRYMRETAIVTKKIPAGPGAWKTIYIPIYGSSIIHKRIPFKDPAVEGRSITINTVSDISRKYKRAENLKDELIDEVRLEEAKAKASVKLPENLEIPEDIAPRVVDCYRPLIALANVAEDNEFLESLWARLREATQSLVDGQQYEPGPIVVQALIYALTKEEQLVIRNVQLEGDLVKIIQYDFGHNLNPRQIAKILRGYGFKLKRIGGPNSVIPDINTLVKVCKTIGIEDEAVNRAAQGLVDPWRTE